MSGPVMIFLLMHDSESVNIKVKQITSPLEIYM